MLLLLSSHLSLGLLQILIYEYVFPLQEGVDVEPKLE